MESVNCNICNNTNTKYFIEINGHRLVKCKNDGLVYLNPRPTPEQIENQYGIEYHVDRLLEQVPKSKEEIEQAINKNIGRMKELVSICGKKKSILDIGCSTGFFLACMKRHGWEAAGIDISDWATKYAKEKLGLEVYTGSVEKVQFDKKFDIVTMYHILEHLPDPLKTLKRAHQLLTENGTLVVNGPNLGSFDRIWHGKRWRGYSDRSHLYFFTPKTYRRLIEKGNFDIFNIIYQYWNPIIHLMETQLGDGIRADHSANIIRNICESKIDASFIFKSINKIGHMTTKFFSLKGRDLTIYARKR